MCMQFGCIPRKSLYLAYSGLDNKRKSIANNQNSARHVLRDMVHEGVMCTEKNKNGNCTALNRENGKYAEEVYLHFNKEHIEKLGEINNPQLDAFRTKISNRARGKRFIEIANMAMFAYGIPGIHILYDDKKCYGAAGAELSYYLPYEFKQKGSTVAGHDSRALGLIHNGDSCYILYVVKKQRRFIPETEYIIQNYLISLYKMRDKVNRLYVYDTPSDISLLCKGEGDWGKNASESLNRYHEVFGRFFLVPQDKNGQMLVRLLLKPQYEAQVLMMCTTPDAVMTARNRNMLCDAYEDDIQILCHMIPDYSKLIAYIRMADSFPEKMYRIYCYDFQESYLIETIPGNVELNSISIEAVYQQIIK